MKSNPQKDQPKRTWMRSWCLVGLLLGGSMVLLAVLVVGCGGSDKSEDTPETEKRLQKLRILSSVYLLEREEIQGERRKRPSEQGFKDFLATMSPHRKQSFGVTDSEALFVSPRDGQPFVFNSGMPSGGHVPAIWEQTGVNGTHYVLYADDQIEEVDEETFTKIKPKTEGVSSSAKE